MTASARTCHAASSRGRPLPLFDPDLGKPSDVPRDGYAWQQPLDGVCGKLLELLPQASVENGLEDRTKELGFAIHVDSTPSTVPGPDLDDSSHTPA